MRKYISLILVVTFFYSPSVFGQSAKYENIFIESDGNRLHGSFYSAEGHELHTTILLIHGWPGSPKDVLGMGERLVKYGFNVLVVSPRGMHESEGSNTFSGTLHDIGASLRWLRSSDAIERFKIDTTNIILGGHSFGGGMAMAYAATDSSVRRIISFAGTDHGEIARKYENDENFASQIYKIIKATQAPEGPIRFDPEYSFGELIEGKAIFGLRENSNKLADREILLIGGWEDMSTTIDDFMLPLYRSLTVAGAENVTFLVYHDNHGYRMVRDQMESDIVKWIKN